MRGYNIVNFNDAPDYLKFQDISRADLYKKK
jgi:hypothetical protein